MSKRLKFIPLALFVASMIGFTACGTVGKDGAAGKDGKSAYDIWLEQGNTGSEQDFLDSLKGDQGIQGDRGIEGEQGKDGKDGATWFTGNACPDEIDVVPLTPNSKVGDLYLCTDCGAVWKKRSDSFWDEIANLKGPKGDKGDPGEVEDTSFKLNVEVGRTAEMPIDLPADTYVVEVALDQQVLSGRLEASVESSVATYSSAFVFSQERTDAANNGTFVYYGYVIVEDSDTKITFAPTSDFELNDRSKTIIDTKVYVKEPWKPPTLKADGTPVEILVNSSNITADKAIKIPLDDSVTAGNYTLTITKEKLSSQDPTGIFDQTDNMTMGSQLAIATSNTVDLTLKGTNPWLVFKPVLVQGVNNYIMPATVSLVAK